MGEGTTRRDREHQQHLRHILDAAESIFAEKGFFRATMRQIARRAEFALGTIYSYFQSKTGLYRRVIETKTEELASFVAREMKSESSVRGQVEKFVQAKMSFFRENLSFLRLYLAEVDASPLDPEHVLREKARQSYDSMLRGLADTMRRGIDEGLLKQADADLLARALDGVTNSFALSWLRSEKRPSVAAECRVAAELFLYGATVRE